MLRMKYVFRVICDPPCNKYTDVGVEGPRGAPKFAPANCTWCGSPLPLAEHQHELAKYSRGEFPHGN